MIDPRKKMSHMRVYTVEHWVAKGTGILTRTAARPKSRQRAKA